MSIAALRWRLVTTGDNRDTGEVWASDSGALITWERSKISTDGHGGGDHNPPGQETSTPDSCNLSLRKRHNYSNVCVCAQGALLHNRIHSIKKKKKRKRRRKAHGADASCHSCREQWGEDNNHHSLTHKAHRNTNNGHKNIGATVKWLKGCRFKSSACLLMCPWQDTELSGNTERDSSTLTTQIHKSRTKTATRCSEMHSFRVFASPVFRHKGNSDQQNAQLSQNKVIVVPCAQ